MASKKTCIYRGVDSWAVKGFAIAFRSIVMLVIGDGSIYTIIQLSQVIIHS